MTEQELYAAILLAHSHGGTRLFRNNAGMAYQGTVVQRTRDILMLSPWRAVRLGVEGMADLTGWTTVHMTGADPFAIYTAIECKSRNGRTSAAQTAFLELVRQSGGRAGIARSIDEAAQIINGGST